MKKTLVLTAFGIILVTIHLAAAVGVAWLLWLIGIPILYAALLGIPAWGIITRIVFRKSGETVYNALDRIGETI